MSQDSTGFSGHHVLITGAGRGIGAAIARRLAGPGVRLSLLGRQLEPLNALAAALPGHAQGVVCDVSDSVAVAAAFAQARQQFGPVHILVNNAGQAASAPLGRTTDELWQTMLGVNLSGSFHCAREVLPDMRAAGWGRIVNIASTAGQRGYPYVAAYVAAKHGVIGLTRALALELATQGITVNAVCPGYTDTDLLRDSVANVVSKTGRSTDEALQEFTRHNPQGRVIQPDEVAATVAWLCSDEAASITGQSLSVSGGEVM